MTFRQWLRQHRDAATATGDIARDVAADQDFPHEPLTWKRIAHHLDRMHASREALVAMRAAWDTYQRENSR